ncbi:MAG: hypothetical protein AB1510_08210 [Bacillota bacterium]
MATDIWVNANVIQALSDYVSLNVDFVDAYLAAKASASGWPVCTFDRTHFNRLTVETFRP